MILKTALVLFCIMCSTNMIVYMCTTKTAIECFLLWILHLRVCYMFAYSTKRTTAEDWELLYLMEYVKIPACLLLGWTKVYYEFNFLCTLIWLIWHLYNIQCRKVGKVEYPPSYISNQEDEVTTQ